MSSATATADISSPRLRRLVRELRSSGRTALARFWREVAESGAPLVEPAPGFPGERVVTVLWREDRPVSGVYVRANRLTDQHNANRGMLRSLDGTDVWFVSLRLPADLRCSYQLYPFEPGDPVPSRLGTGPSRAEGLTDPLNRSTSGRFGSLIELDGAPSLADWYADEAPGRTDAFGFTTSAGQTYRVRRFIPDATGELGLLVVLDGEKWFDRYGIAAAVAAGAAAGRFPPTAVVGIEAGPPGERMQQLGANPRFVDALADELVPAVARELPGWAGSRRTVLCGQSLGGLTALVAALRRPATFGSVLAHSASVWWRPGMTARPPSLPEGDTWLFEQFAAAPVGNLGIRIDVGSNEGAMLLHLRKLHALLRERGFNASLRVYSGGHDHCCWAAALTEGLTEMHTNPRYPRKDGTT
ncbi:catecholate siderophore esterase IroD [Amycolatopsis ultiminotia]|uniref:Catecholate siderophore esterase IroD n=1 Tax=Amycolatopsis ultiminotia TaxID=543629 RepID=A0ABP6YT14_9PSEU